MTPNAHPHQTLGENQIRLFRFNRLARPITGSLTVHDLTEAPDYNELSYTWATAYSHEIRADDKTLSDFDTQKTEQLNTIYINGSPQVINHNLYSALHDLDLRRDLDTCGASIQTNRAPTTMQPLFDALWIDAICISQNDPEEKASQVQMMDRIFSRAQNVLVYLGPKSPLLDSLEWCAYDFTPRIFRLSEEILQLYSGDGIIKPQLHYGLGYSEDAQVVKKLTEGIRFLAQCRWFQRTWTLQEKFLASNMLMFVGTRSLWLDPVQDFVKQCVERHWDSSLVQNIRHTSGICIPQVMIQNAYKRERTLWESTRVSKDIFYLASRALEHYKSDAQVLDSENYQAFRLADMLVTSASMFCSDRRDKIFACLGMAKIYCPRIAAHLVVEYESSWRELFLRVSTLILSNSRILDLLALIPDALSNTEIGLPTWALNFDLEAKSIPFWNGITQDNPSPNVLGNLRGPTPGFSIVGSCLTCSAAYFDTISSVNMCDDLSDSHYILGLLRFAHLLRPSILGRSRVEVLWRTYILDGVQKRPMADKSIQGRFIVYLLVRFVSGFFHGEPNGAEVYDKEEQRYLKAEFVKLSAGLFLPIDMETETVDTLEFRKKETRKTKDIIRRLIYGRKLLNRMQSPEPLLSRMLTSLMYWHYRKISSTGLLLDQLDLDYNEFTYSCTTEKRRLFITKRGLCGSGSFRCEQGDQIWCLGNAHSPYLVRSTGTISADGKRQQFRLVGEVYILDFMDGRMMEPEYGVADHFQEIDIV